MAIKCPHCGEPIDLSTQTDGFEQFYDAYPRKVGRGQAIKAYGRAMTKTDKDTLIKAARAFRDLTSRRTTDASLVPHPATWLNGERWLDEELTTPLRDSLGDIPTKQVTNAKQVPSVHSSWPTDKVEKISKAIGETHFRAWLGDSVYVQGLDKNPTIITASSSFKRDWIAKKYLGVLTAVIGLVEVR